MKKLLFLGIALIGLGMFATPKAEAGVYIGIGLPVLPIYPAYYPAYYGPVPYYGYPCAYGYRGYYGYGRVYNGRVVKRSTRSARPSISDK